MHRAVDRLLVVVLAGCAIAREEKLLMAWTARLGNGVLAEEVVRPDAIAALSSKIM